MDPKDASDFSGKVAVVTGGSGVLCSAMALALGERGASVVVVGHSRPERAESVADRIRAAGGEAMAAQADLLDRQAVSGLRQRVMDRFGRVDILINGAGGARQGATTSDTLSFFDQAADAVRGTFDLNFMGTFLPCQEFGRIMVDQDEGVILNIGSMGAFKPLTRSVAYSAAKSAIVNFTQWLAVHMSQEYSPRIRVNALMPGYFSTEQNRFLLFEPSGEFTPRGARIVDHTPMGRLGLAEDLIGPALFLLSDAAQFVHGATLAVDGGVSAYGGV